MGEARFDSCTKTDGDQNLGHGRGVVAFRRGGVAGLLGSRPTWSHPGSPRLRHQVADSSQQVQGRVSRTVSISLGDMWETVSLDMK